MCVYVVLEQLFSFVDDPLEFGMSHGPSVGVQMFHICCRLGCVALNILVRRLCDSYLLVLGDIHIISLK